MRVHAAVDALDLVDVFLEGAVVGEEPGLPGEIIVVRDDRPGVAVGAEVLPGIEAERPGQPECPGVLVRRTWRNATGRNPR